MSAKNGLDPAQALRDNDLQVTAQRMAVLRAVFERQHGTAHDLAEDVRREIGAISRQSVHDTLTLLTERDIIRRVQPAGSAARYEIRVRDEHQHLACRLCDMLVDVHRTIDDPPSVVPVEDGDFIVDEAEVIFWGICPACQTPAA